MNTGKKEISKLLIETSSRFGLYSFIGTDPFIRTTWSLKKCFFNLKFGSSGKAELLLLWESAYLFGIIPLLPWFPLNQLYHTLILLMCRFILIISLFARKCWITCSHFSVWMMPQHFKASHVSRLQVAVKNYIYIFFQFNNTCVYCARERDKTWPEFKSTAQFEHAHPSQS